MQKIATNIQNDYQQFSDRELVHFFVICLDQEAFAEIVRRYERLVMSVCRRACRSREDAEDAFQATFIALAHRPRQLRKTGSLSSWLYSVAWRTSIRANRIRRKQTMQTVAEDTPSPNPALFVQITRDRDMAVLDEELNDLPDNYRTVLVMNFLAGRTAQQIADELQTSKGVVDGRLQRAKNALRVRLVRRGVTLSALTIGTLSADTAVAASPALIQQTIETGKLVSASSSRSALDSAMYQLARPELGGLRTSLLHVIALSAFMLLGAAGWHESGRQLMAAETAPVVLHAEIESEDGEALDADQPVDGVAATSGPDGDAPVVQKSDVKRFQSIAESRLMAAAGRWGTVSGQIVFDGDIPILPLIVAAGAPVKHAVVCSVRNLPDQSLIVDPKTHGVQHCFVYLRKAPSAIHPLLADPAIKTLYQDQKNCRYVPHTTFAQVGQTVETISSDPIAHNTHPFPLRNSPLNVLVAPNARRGQGSRWTPLRAEILPIQVKCDFHSWMMAYWLVLDHPYAAITDSEGRFRICGLPEGDHTLVVWHERVGYVQRQLSVTVLDETVEVVPPIRVPADRFAN